MTKPAESRWREVVRAQERSGQCVREFAAAEGIVAGTLYWWRSELKRRGPELVPVSVLEDGQRPSRAASEELGFELVVDEMRLWIPNGFDAGELRRLVGALRC